MPISDTLLPLVRSRTLARVALYAFLVGLYGVIPVVKEYSALENFGDAPATVHAALTLVLGWLLVFRTNKAYERWWEARTLWGSLVNCSRNLAVKVSGLAKLQTRQRERMRNLLVQFPIALRDHLRGEKSAVDSAEPSADAAQHVPSDLMQQLYHEVWTWKDGGLIDGDELRILDAECRRFLEICGGCERIKRTPIAQSYRFFARQCIFLFLLTFPWAIAQDFKEWTIALTAIVAYFMLGMETVAEHVEEPFGRDEDDLDLDGLCHTIRDSVQQIFNSRDGDS